MTHDEELLVIGGLLKSFAALAARGDTVPTGVVEAVLERPARPFADYVADAAACGVWRQSRT